MRIAQAHATYYPQRGGYIDLTQIDRYQNIWEDKYGIQLHIENGLIKQITLPDYENPNDNDYIGTIEGMKRDHPLFKQYMLEQNQKALEVLKDILGAYSVNKPMPENGGTIYFYGSETDYRYTEEFQLQLDLESDKMQKLLQDLYNYNELPISNFEDCARSLKGVCYESEH